jgi:hypothetical protein
MACLLGRTFRQGSNTWLSFLDFQAAFFGIPTVEKDWRSAKDQEVTNLDERAVLLPGGTLWRVNPTSARGMKKGLRTV